MGNAHDRVKNIAGMFDLRYKKCKIHRMSD